MKRIESIEFNNIGVFKNEKIVFPEVNISNKAEIHIFTGPNGSGKTTILEGLLAFFNHNSTIFTKIGNYDSSSMSVTFNKKTVEYNNSSDGMRQWIKEHNPIAENSSILETIRFANTTFAFNLHQIELALFAYSSYREIKTSNTINIASNESPNPLYQALELKKVAGDKPQTLQWIANAITKQALAAMRGNEQKSKSYGRIIAKIETIISDIIGQKITLELLDNPIKVILKQNGNEITFEALSDGLKSLISWIADLLLRLEQTPWVDDIPVLERNFILFLDEIEVHLHPALQRKVLPIVQDLFPNAQIFISTHSPFVVGSISNAWVYKLELNEGESTISKPIESKAGVSFLSILEDIFDVDEEFDVQTEDLLDEFYALRNKIAKGEKVDNTIFKNLITTLSSKSVEVKDIIERELRQLQRKGRL